MKLSPPALRKLLAIARRRGLSEAEAEECVQEALLALSTQPSPPDNPEAFLATVVRRRAIDAMRQEQVRREKASTVAAAEIPNGSEGDLVEEVLRLDGAIENVIMWGGEGATRRIVRSFADVNVQATLRWLIYCRTVIKLLPRSDRRLQVYCEQFEADLARAVERSGYVFDTHRPRPAEVIHLGKGAPGSGVDADPPPAGARKGRRGRGTILLVDPTLSRGVRLALRFVPDLGFHEALRIAQLASDEVYGPS